MVAPVEKNTGRVWNQESLSKENRASVSEEVRERARASVVGFRAPVEVVSLRVSGSEAILVPTREEPERVRERFPSVGPGLLGPTREYP